MSIENVHTIDIKTTEILLEIDLQGDIAVDHEGNKIIVGSFWGENVAFDEANKITSNGNKNIFIAKYDTENTILWLKNIGGETILLDFGILTNQANDAATSVSIDTNNNIYILTQSNLNSEQIVDYDAAHIHTSSILETGYDRNEQIVFAKYTSDGELQWIKTIGDIFNDKAYKMVLDKNNEIWITGTMGGYSGNQIDFDKDKTHPDNKDILVGQFGHLGFIAHYDNDGNFISVKGIGGGSTYFTHLNMYPGTMGNLYLTGSISAYNTQLFLEDTNPQTLNSNGKFELWPQNEDAFIIKYSNEGDIKWIKTN